MALPLASLRTRRSFSNSSLAVDNRTPSAPVTNRRANAAHVSGRCRYGCKNSALFLARALDSAVDCVNGFSLTNACPSFNTRAAAKIKLPLISPMSKVEFKEIFFFYQFLNC